MTDTQVPEPRAFRTAAVSPEEALDGLDRDELIRHLRAVQQVTDAALAHLKLDALLNVLIERIRDLVAVDAVRILLCSPGGQSLTVRAASGLEEDNGSSVPVPIGQGIAGWVAYHRSAVIVDDVSRVHVVNPLMRRLHSAMVAPLLVEGQLLGVLKVGTTAARTFRDTDLALLQLVADRAALAIDRARQFEAVLRTEQQRQEEKQRYRSLFDNNPAAIFTLDPGGRFLDLNPAALRLSGRTAEELLGQPFDPLIVEERREQAQATLRDTLAGQPARLDTVITHKNGNRIELAITTIPIAVDGEVSGVYGIAEDLTAQRRAADDIRFLADVSSMLHSTLDYRRTLRHVVRLAVPGFADWCVLDLLDAQGRPTRQEGAHVDPARERRIRQLQRRLPSNFQDADHPIYRAFHTGNSILISELTPELLDRFASDPEHLEILRSLRLESAMIVPLRGRERTLGVLTFASAMVNRVYSANDLALAEEVAQRSALAIENAELFAAAQDANRAKSDFLAVMSHELRTPLTAILGYAELLQMGIPQTVPDEALNQIERIEAAARQQLQLIEEILTFSRLSEGQEVVSAGRIDLTAAVHDAIAFIGPAAGKKQIALRAELPDTPCELSTDASKVRQILVNLLFNAVQFTAEGQITVRLECDEAEVRLHVCDTGIGIAPEHHRKVFDAFWQVRQSSTREVGGTGLGLTVAQRMAQLLGGEITLRSALNQGSTFTLHLPRGMTNEE
jgi:PAS domain S-box-containing protein